MDGVVQGFITLWVVIDPLGTLPVFMTVAAGLGGAPRRRLAFEATAIAFGVLAGFAFFGRAVLDVLDISLVSFRIAGGIVLLLFALTLIFGDDKHERDLASYGGVDQAAAFPVAIPSLASPGAMLTVVLLADGESGPIPWFSLALLAGAMATALIILLAAEPLHKAIGDAGAAVISRVMGMILAAVAVDEMLRALVEIELIPAL